MGKSRVVNARMYHRAIRRDLRARRIDSSTYTTGWAIGRLWVTCFACGRVRVYASGVRYDTVVGANGANGVEGGYQGAVTTVNVVYRFTGSPGRVVTMDVIGQAGRHEGAMGSGGPLVTATANRDRTYRTN